MGRMEILTSRERRRIWSDKQKLDILADVASSGQSIVEIARRHDIVPGSSRYEYPFGQVMAASVTVTLPLLVLVLIFQRKIVAGLTSGAVKG